MLTVVMLGLRDLRASGHDILGPTLKLTPIWHQAYLAVMVLAMAQMARACISLFRPLWTRFRLTASVVFGAIWLAILSIFLAAGPWIALVDDSRIGDKGRMIDSLNHYFFYSLLVVAVFSIVQLVLDVRPMNRQGGDGGPALLS